MQIPRSLVSNIQALWTITSKPIRWAMAGMVMLGLLSSFMESLGVSLAVLLVYTAIAGESVAKADGLLGEVFNVAQRISSQSPILLGAMIAGIVVGTSLCTAAYSVVAAWIKNSVYHTVRASIFEQYMRLSYDYMAQKDYGYLTNTLQVETWYISEAVQGISRLAINFCSIAVFVGILTATSWQLAVATAASGFLYLGTVRAVRNTLRRKGEQANVLKEQLAERMISAIQGLRTVRLYGAEESIIERYSVTSDQVRRLFMALEAIGAMIKPVAEITTLIVIAVIVWLSNALGNSTALTLTVIALVYRLQPHIREIQNNLMSLAGMTASVNVVVDAMDQTGKPYPKQGRVAFGGLKHEIVLDGVCYTHPGSTEPSLDGVSIRIAKGTTTVIVGASGAGKTTLVNLLLHLTEPSGGQVTVDGIRLGDIERSSWLKRVVGTGQDIDLLEGSIMENVRLGRPEASVEQVRRALDSSGILDFIDQLPEGLDTHVGERGLRLSGGQRQRISLARAFVAEPDVLILDEATNAIDNVLESEIYRNLRVALPSLTMIVIAHRSSVTYDADQVIVLDQGRVIDVGPPHQLSPTSDALLGAVFHHAV